MTSSADPPRRLRNYDGTENESRASLEANVEVELAHLAQHHPLYRAVVASLMRLSILTAVAAVTLVVVIVLQLVWVIGIVAFTGIYLALKTSSRWTTWRKMRHYFQQFYWSSLLTTGLVLATRPLTVGYLAELGNGAGPTYYGLKVKRLLTLPHVDHQVGAVFPCMSSFFPGAHPDRWDDFMSNPIAWATADPAIHQRALKRLPVEEVDIARRCVELGRFPKKEGALIVLDENLNPLR
jgi:hypothetical protein